MPLLLSARPVALLLILTACGGERASGPLAHEAYVWQRQWSPAMRTALSQASGLSGLVVLGAEVDLRRQPVRIARVPLDPALREVKRSVGVALRIHTFPRRFADSPEAVRLVTGLAAEVVAQARDAGLALSELQLDYDCPESRLDDYPVLVEAVRREMAPVPVTVTALPSWLRRDRAFAALASAADGYVLQVHSLTRPAGPEVPLTLCDPEEARRSVERAARFGHPFRVALPTYGYTVIFDAQGRRAGVSAEGPEILPPPGGTSRTVRSDPEAMAGLVRGWTADRPAELSGVIWYRLPTAGDRLNWPWPTLRAVMEGRPPSFKMEAETRRPAPGLVEIDLVNRGEAEAPWPGRLRVRWSHPRMLAADGLAGYRLRRTGPGEIHLERGFPEGVTSRPGDRRTIAWLRFEGEPGSEEIRIDVASPTADSRGHDRGGLPAGRQPALGLRSLHLRLAAGRR